MRYTASEKFGIIRLVEQSNLSVRQTLLLWKNLINRSATGSP